MRFQKSIALLIGLLLPACASIVEGTDQSIAVNLSPDNAHCDVFREGAQLTTVSKDQRFINISKSKNDLLIECKAPDHHSEKITLESSASGWGVVGCFLIDLCITDYSTGALNKYPEAINITLAPNNFPSAESRDQWFITRQDEIEGRWNELIESKTTACKRAADRTECESEINEIIEHKSQELAKLERQRLETEISASETSSESMQTTSIAERLSQLEALRDSGAITEKEYQAKRSEILSDL